MIDKNDRSLYKTFGLSRERFVEIYATVLVEYFKMIEKNGCLKDVYQALTNNKFNKLELFLAGYNLGKIDLGFISAGNDISYIFNRWNWMYYDIYKKLGFETLVKLLDRDLEEAESFLASQNLEREVL